MGHHTYTNRVKRQLSDATTDAAKVLRKAEKEMGHVTLLLWEELPEWQQDGNQFIETGYRYASLSLHRSGDLNNGLLDHRRMDRTESA